MSGASIRTKSEPAATSRTWKPSRRRRVQDDRHAVEQAGPAGAWIVCKLGIAEPRLAAVTAQAAGRNSTA